MARELNEIGIRASVISGGLQAWRKGKFPVEPVPVGEIVPLPRFS